MYSIDQIEDILFIDIETAAGLADFEQLPERMQYLWGRKSRRYKTGTEDDMHDIYADKAGLHAEFGRVVCVSCGYVRFNDKKEPRFRVKSFYGPDEKKILMDTSNLLSRYSNRNSRNLCAHNGKEFDFPYLNRRFLINAIPIPGILQIQGKKPWEVTLLDTMDIWRFGEYKAYTSLDLLAAVLEVETSKDDIDGSEVSKVFWEDGGHDRIRQYCEKDVYVTAQILLKMSLLPALPPFNPEKESIRS